MVFLGRMLMRAHRDRTNFIDKLRVYVRGGGGGQGHPKFGGRGGNGGNVYVVGMDGMTLKKLVQLNPMKRFVAATGLNSSRRALVGDTGQDIEINVPLGVCVKEDSGKIIGEVNEAGERVLVASGGLGGVRDNGYQGARAHPRSVNLDLKLIADVGLVGFPNAGKSTFLSAVSRAAPKIAAYPFTTIRPQLGIIQYEDHRQISMADLPGLIEGAHHNVGMGHSFLKHVERTQLLLFVIDVTGFQLSLQYPRRSPLQTVLLLNRELELYREDLMSKPAVLAINKIDIPGTEDALSEVLAKVENLKEHLDEVDTPLRPRQLVKFDAVIPISAKQRQSTDALTEKLRSLLDLYDDISVNTEQASEQASELVRRRLTEYRGGRPHV